MKGEKYYKRLHWFQRQVEKITKSSSSASEIITSILNLSQSPEWIELAHFEAYRMVKEISVSNASTWRQAAKSSRSSVLINKMLKQEVFVTRRFSEIISRNESLIKSIPNTVAKHLLEKTSSSVLTGARVEAQVRELAPDISKNVARLIIRTETAKTQAAITQIRAEQAGLDLYIWHTVHDQRVRSSHKHMDGIICSYKNPPSPEGLDGKESIGNYNPGEIWNCRCYAEPVIDIDFLVAPYKIALNSQIQWISKKQLVNLFT